MAQEISEYIAIGALIIAALLATTWLIKRFIS